MLTRTTRSSCKTAVGKKGFKCVCTVFCATTSECMAETDLNVTRLSQVLEMIVWSGKATKKGVNGTPLLFATCGQNRYLLTLRFWQRGENSWLLAIKLEAQNLLGFKVWETEQVQNSRYDVCFGKAVCLESRKEAVSRHGY